MKRLKTRLFELEGERHCMAELATLLNLSMSQVWRVKYGKRGIHERVIIGALTAFPKYSFEELFYISY